MSKNHINIENYVIDVTPGTRFQAPILYQAPGCTVCAVCVAKERWVLNTYCNMVVCPENCDGLTKGPGPLARLTSTFCVYTENEDNIMTLLHDWNAK